MNRYLSEALVRGGLAGTVGGLVLATMFALPGGYDLLRYDLNKGNPWVGYVVVVVLGLLIGALYGRTVGTRIRGVTGQALGLGLLFGLGWYVLIVWIILPLLIKGAPAFALSARTFEDLVLYLVYGMVLSTGYMDLPALVGGEHP